MPSKKLSLRWPLGLVKLICTLYFIFSLPTTTACSSTSPSKRVSSNNDLSDRLCNQGYQCRSDICPEYSALEAALTEADYEDVIQKRRCGSERSNFCCKEDYNPIIQIAREGCKAGMACCEEKRASSYLMIVGDNRSLSFEGWRDWYWPVELLSLSPDIPLPECLNRTRSGLHKAYMRLEGTVGMTFGDRVLVCGNDVSDDYSCWVYDAAEDKWAEDSKGNRGEGGKYSAALSHKYGWVIIREKFYWNDDSVLVEHTHDGRNYESLPPLPHQGKSFEDLCLVSLDDEAGVGDLLVLGEVNDWAKGGQYPFILKDGMWEEKERRPTNHTSQYSGYFCGPVRSQVGGPVEKIVVAGGYSTMFSHLVTVYDVRKDSWEMADDLPFGCIGSATAIPYEDTFLLIGGWGYKNDSDHRSYSDKVWKYKQNGEWEEMRHLQLSEGKAYVTAIVVQSDIFPRCYRAHFEVKNSSDTVWPAETCSAGT